jgi:signal transduction histidine kinase/CheY-like chemotaxis protein/HPt (histidine-containing phosphotransfer) domain-containing protein
MIGKRIILYILAAFIAGNLLLIYIQYNSAKNINTLIKGNEKVLAEVTVSNNLRELKRDITVAEGTIGSNIFKRNAINKNSLKQDILNVQGDIDNLQKISDDDSSEKYIDILDVLVHEKLNFTSNDPDSLNFPGTYERKGPFDLYREKQLNDSIRIVTRQIETSRQKLLAKVTASIDASGKKALNLGTSLIVFVLLSGAVIFWAIISTIKKQNLLIHKLNISEKNVREAARVKENFMANMSHEIRTPLNAILGFTNLLQRNKLGDDSQEFVQAIQKSGESLLNIINDILDLSKIEAGMMRIESMPFSIRGLVNSVITMFATKANEKKLKLFDNVDETIPDNLEGDAVRLTQILVNLIGNALKFTEKGSITINISNEGITEDIVKTGIAITDTGIGIEKEKLQYIFERFQQAEDSVTRKYGGTGLGLSIVKDLVTLQKGNIEVTSTPGKGTTFYLTLNYKISPELTQKSSSGKIITGHYFAFQNVSILVVEDNEINQNLIKHLFNNWHLNFDLANNGKEAINKLKAGKYDLILMDIQMPAMDGYTATREIRENLKLDTPIIAMTAHAMAGEREKCLSYGMNEYISKPIREAQLHKLVDQFTKKNKNTYWPKETEKKSSGNNFQYINLNYMKEVSLGNHEYEKLITEQFIEAIPAELNEIRAAWHNQEFHQLRYLAHNMKTSISVMQLNEMMQPYLDALENENLTETTFHKNFSSLEFIGRAALEEAKFFYETL